MLARLSLGATEEAAFSSERRRLLERLAAAGNAVACYRLGVALSYYPTANQQDNEQGRVVLRRLAQSADAPDSLRADAAFECWLLMRRLPEQAASCDDLLELAVSLGHTGGRLGAFKHKSKTGCKSQTDFSVSADCAAMQSFLCSALCLHPPNPQTASVCRNPSCGRWGVRARARANGIVGPPALPRCQGLQGGHCRARCTPTHPPTHLHDCPAHTAARA